MRILILIYFLTLNFAFSQENKETQCVIKPFEVFLDDVDNYTNIRNNPNGKIILKINNEDSYGHMMNVIDFKNGWLKINEIIAIDEYIISELEGWIHSSIVGISLTHSEDLLDKPNGEKKLELKGESGEIFKIIDVHCEWLKIKTKKGDGWIKSEKICGNPVTTCP